MRKHLLIALASAVITVLCCQPAPAQLPGGLKIPKVGKPKPTPTPVETAQPAPPGETQPAARPQPSAPAQTQPAAGSGSLAVLKNLVSVDARTVTSYKGDGSTFSWTPVIKFNVGPDGNFAGGVPLLYRVRNDDGDRFPGVIVPVTVLDDQDGTWDRNAWKTGAFYGNPPAGFTPAP